MAEQRFVIIIRKEFQTLLFLKLIFENDSFFIHYWFSFSRNCREPQCMLLVRDGEVPLTVAFSFDAEHHFPQHLI